MSTMNIAKPKRRTVWDFIKQQPLGFIGLILILIMSIAAIFSPEVAPYHPEVLILKPLLHLEVGNHLGIIY